MANRKTKPPVAKATPRRKPSVALVNKPRGKRAAPSKAVQEVVKAPVMEALAVPTALLLAGEAIAAKADKDASALHGVLIHQVDAGRVRIAARDGSRVFVASFPLGSAKQPSWLKDGLLLARGDLKARLTMLSKVEMASSVLITHAAGTRDAELSDGSRSCVMRIDLGAAARFPSYERALSAASFTSMDFEGEVDKRDWHAVGFSSRSLKHCGDIAKILEDGIPKDKRPPEGMVIRAFGGNENAPKVFDFPQYPGALLILQPIPAGDLPLAADTVAVLAPAVKLTIAALRAHETRWLDRATASTDEAERKAALERATGFKARVDALLLRTPSVQAALPQPSPAVEEPAGTDRELVTVH